METHRQARRGLAWARSVSAAVCLMLAGSAVSGPLTLSWTDNAMNESGSRIERRLSPSGTYSEIATVGPNVTAYSDETVTGGQSYCYRVRAFNAAGNSAYSDEACGTAATPPPPPALVTLAVVKTGSGTISGPGLSCGPDCSETVLSGTTLTLTATPASGAVFTGWSGGGCAGTGPCTLTVTGPTSVTATFAAAVTLTVSKTGNGTVSGPGLNCGADCSETVSSGTALTLTATPASGAVFTGWSGGGCAGTAPCTVTVTGATTVAALFSESPVLQFSSGSYSVSEASPAATITVTRVPPATIQSEVHFETSSGTAAAGTDYTHTGGHLVFHPGEWSKSFAVAVTNTTVVDGPRTILLRLRDPRNARLGDQQTAVLTVQNDDAGGTVRFSATGYTYPDSPGYATITVTRTGGMAAGASVQYRTGNAGTAVPGIDYIAINPPQTLTFNANETSKTLQLRVLGNALATDPTKTVQLLLGDPANGATLGTPSSVLLTITNDDTGGGLRFSASTLSIAEGARHATVTVTRAGGAGSGVSVLITALDGSAKAGVDYRIPMPSVVSFGAGETSKTVDVPLVPNPMATSNRSLTLKLESPSGGASLSSPSRMTLTIVKTGIRFSQTAYTVNEGPGSAMITVVRTGTAAAATVQVQTQDGSAVSPTDFTAIGPPKILTFQAGRTSHTFAVPVANNPGSAANRSLRLRLLNATGEAMGTPDEATLTILDKDVAELEVTAFGAPTTGLAGKTIAVSTTVRNLSGRYAGPSTLRFVLSRGSTLGSGDDVILGTRGVGTLGGGESSSATTTLTIPGATEPGSYTLLAVADASNTVPEQSEGNNVSVVPLTVVSSLAQTFSVSGVVNYAGCVSPLRNGRLATLGSLAFSSQTGTSLTGTLTLASPLVPGTQTSGPLQATVDTAGRLTGTFSYTTSQGSMVVSTGTGTLTGTVTGAALDVEAIGQALSGETCDFAAALTAPLIPVTLMAFDHHAAAGPLDEVDGALVAIPSFPAGIARYRVLLEIAGGPTPFAPPGMVRFTGPGGSRLTRASGAELSQLANNVAEYRSPFVVSPPVAPAGTWTAEYGGQSYEYAMVDPEAPDRLVIPVPTFVQDTGQLQQVTWVYRSAHGAALAEPPAFVHRMRVLLLDPCGVVLHDSLDLAPTTTSRTLSPRVEGAALAEVRFQYGDDMDNLYTVSYGGATPGACKMVQFSVASFNAAENVKSAPVTVRRSGDLTGAVAVNFTTSDGTARMGQDYGNASQVVAFDPGVSSRVVGVPILDNGTPQGPRTVLLRLGAAGGSALLGPLSTAVLTINDDDPRVQFASPTYVAVEQASTATVSVQRTGATSTLVSVPYWTADGTALSGLDYQAQAGVLTFAAGQTSKTFTVPILNDTLAEGSQTINLVLGNPTGALLGNPATALLTIADKDTAGAVGFSAATFSVGEEAAAATITVLRTGGTGGDVMVQYATRNGTGQAGTDYVASSGTLVFGPGESSKTFTVPVRRNVGSAANKSVILTLANPSPGATLGTPTTAILWIVSQ